MQSAATTPSNDLVYVGFNSRIAALDRRTGELVWEWRSPSGSGYVSLLCEDGVLFASVDGYTYALDPRNGNLLWENHLPGMGTGVACLATARASTAQASGVAAQAEQDARSRAHGNTGSTA